MKVRCVLMEYVSSSGTIITVKDDTIQYGDGKVRKQVIGPNHSNGVIFGGYLSSFNKPTIIYLTKHIKA